MSETTTPVSKDSPLWLAWEAYAATEEYANTKRWAVVPEHAEGSLWAAFERGFAARQPPSPIAGKADEMPDFVKADLDEIFWKHPPVTPTRTIRWFADDRERLLARITGLAKERDAWRDFAGHQRRCADCAESVASCPIGTAMLVAAVDACEDTNASR